LELTSVIGVKASLHHSMLKSGSRDFYHYAILPDRY
jgi:hypothetical protein